ncbi:MAG: ABC transporter substrate-binding protein, partial [Acidimicrobiaceae bacterium]|nr:ABC transporter substrate-binding protein [Acidimicrobiaceae bacterium]
MLLLAAACGSDDGDDSTAQAPATTVTSTTAAPQPEPVEEPPSTTTEAPASTTTEAAAATTTEPAAALDEDEHAYQRIVSISPTATEMVFAIGAGDRVVAVDQFSYYPAEAPVTDLDGWNPNIEAIASYDPDLVLM